jgi:hypothetical protein
MSGTYLRAKQGSELPWSKLNDTLVRRIREEHAAKERAKQDLDAQFSAEAFAKRYGVHKNTIDKVLTYATWRHVL